MSFKHVVAGVVLAASVFSAQAGCLGGCILCCLVHCTSKYHGKWTTKRIAAVVKNPCQDMTGRPMWYECCDEPPGGWPKGRESCQTMECMATGVLDGLARVTFSSCWARAKFDRLASHVIADLSSPDWFLRIVRSNTLRVCAHDPTIARYLACWLATECLCGRLDSVKLFNWKDTFYIFRLANKFYSVAIYGDA
jgi:hypothetical protein